MSFRCPNRFRILAPTAILGYGFPKTSFDMSQHYDLIAVDAGSIDPGPYYLATRSSFTSIPQIQRDLRIIIEGAMAQKCPLVIGSAGGCGTNNQLYALETEVRTILKDIGASATIATVSSEVSSDLLKNHKLQPLGKMPELDKTRIQESVIVAQMGVEPIITALNHADIVLCGRAYDPAVFAAEPLRRGFPAGITIHAAKILECGAIAADPGSGSDCFAAELSMDGVATVWAPNKARTATPLSVSAHTLYEKSHPHCFPFPGGVLCTKNSTFTQRERKVDVRGSQVLRTVSSVKIEAAAIRGHRAIAVALVKKSVGNIPNSFVYGINGVENRPLRCGEEELGLLILVSGGTSTENSSFLASLRATLLHWGFEGRKATAGNLAFPFSPSDMQTEQGEMLTICGTRDPFFISCWSEILQDAKSHVESMFPSQASTCTVRIIPCGLPGMAKLAVAESISDTFFSAASALPTFANAKFWICDGGKATNYTMQHLMDVDDKLMQKLFSIRIISSDGDVHQIPVDYMCWNSGELMSAEKAKSLCNQKSFSSTQYGNYINQKICNIARVVRSKNSGVNEITFDIIFDTFKKYEMAKQSPSLAVKNLESVLERDIIGVYYDDTSYAIKITCERELVGNSGERDVYGAQQHSSLLRLEL